jgi:hypothetical protein
MPESADAAIDTFQLSFGVIFGFIDEFFQPTESVNDSTSSALSLPIQLFFKQVDLFTQGLQLLPFGRAILLVRGMIAGLMATVAGASRNRSVQGKSYTGTSQPLHFRVQQDVSTVSFW